MPLSQVERSIKNTFLEVILRRVINDKSASKNNKMVYGYNKKLLKEYENVLLWINEKNTEKIVF